METLQICALFAIFLLMTLLMFYRILPALLALPLMAILLALVGGVQAEHVMSLVVGKGPLKLHSAYVVAIFGGMLSVILQKTGVAESFIKKGAELSGDNPWLVSVTMLVLIILLFTTLGGLGAIIMVATIVLPVLSSVGVGPLTTVGIFLLGISIGGTLNVGNWALYIQVMGLKVEEVRPFALTMFTVVFLLALLYITLQLYFDGHALAWGKILRNMLVCSGLATGGLVIYYYFLLESQRTFLGNVMLYFGWGLKWGLGGLMASLTGLIFYRAYKGLNQSAEVHWSSFFSPLIPLLLIICFQFDFIAAFILGLLYTFVATYRRGRLNLFIQSCLEGAAVVMPAVILMFGIGMVLVAIMGPGGDWAKENPGLLEAYPQGWPVLNLIKPVMSQIVPSQPILYVVIFTVLAPLALYRGPLNLWGMGFGLATVFMASGLSPAAVMGLLMAVGQIQGISDPTNTQNVWLANEMRVDVQKVLWNTLPYAWGAAFIGLIFSAWMHMGA